MSQMFLQRADRGIEGFLFVVLCGVLSLAPVIYGTTDPIIVLNFELILIGAFSVWSLRLVFSPTPINAYNLLIPAALLAVYGWFQTLPIMSPQPLGSIDASLLGNGFQWRSISLDPAATRQAVLKLVSLIIGGFLAVNLINSKGRLNVLVNIIVITGFILSIFAIIQDFTWNGKIYWIRETRFEAFGPFVNKDHAAGYLEIPLGLGLGMLLRKSFPADRRLIYGFFTVVTATAIVVSRSRGGLLSLCGMIVLVLLVNSFGRTSSDRSLTETKLAGFLKVGLVTAVSIAALLALSLYVKQESLIYSVQSLGQTETYRGLGGRREVWGATLGMIKQSPLLGSGLGAYGVSFPKFTNINGALTTDYAHNDYLQALADAGIIGGLLFLAAIVLYLRHFFRSYRNSRGYYNGFQLGVFGAVAALMIHSLVDFNLQVYCTALTLTVLIGASYSATRIFERGRLE